MTKVRVVEGRKEEWTEDRTAGKKEVKEGRKQRSEGRGEEEGRKKGQK